MPPESFANLLDRYRTRIDERLRSLVDSCEPSYLYDPIKYVFRGKGKRLRPILVFLSAKMFDVPAEKAMPAALAVEILHNFSLVHDDIMDADDLRHGLLTVHRKWDQSAAILAGDAIFALAYVQLAEVRTNAIDCIRVFNNAAIKLCEGQALDKGFETRDEVSMDEYLNMVRLKTGILLSLCCQLGAIVGDADGRKQQLLGEFGELLGQAFQVQDDVLEIFSSAENMGKSLGSDVVTKKKTYLTCRALESDPDGWQRLMQSMGEGDLQTEIMPALRLYFEDTGIRAQADEEVNRLVSLSKSKLEGFRSERRCDLDYFVEMMMARKR